MTIIIGSWVVRITLFAPEGVSPLDAASIDAIPGPAVIVAVGAFYLVIIGMTLWPTDRQAKGEKREVSEQTKRWGER